MTSPFIQEHDKLRLLFPGASPLRRAQAGAIWAAASHFTVSSQSAILSMPTGSGKTLVAVLLPYLLQATRVLVVTPSRIVRNQVHKEFSTLALPKGIGALPSKTPKLAVKSVTKQVATEQAWAALAKYDVLLATPHVVSPGYERIPSPPPGLIDLLIIDEAHHAPAQTWAALLDAFPHAKSVLLTATPFRRDRKEVPGLLIYDYPLSRAIEDGIFAPIDYVPADPVDGDRDGGLILAAASAIAQERAAGLHGALLVRTDRISEAERLRELYAQAGLSLAVVHSRSLRQSEKAIHSIAEGALDGLVCVDMLGEGFDLPRLKIAVLHSPHRSLPATLQFVGRVARVGAPQVGPARVIAIPTSNPTAKTPESELLRLFQRDANWRELIPGLAKGAMESEQALRRFFAGFSYEGLTTLSARSVRPPFKAVVFDTEGLQPDLTQEPNLSLFGEAVFTAHEADLGCTIWITAAIGRPPWLQSDEMTISQADLHVAYRSTVAPLLFLQSPSPAGIDALRDAVCPGASRVSPERLDALLRHEDVVDVFNIGIANVAPRAARRPEYTIYAGKQANGAIRPGEARRSTLGHASARVSLGDPTSTEVRGASMRSASAWSSRSGDLLRFTQWCDEVAALIAGSRPSEGFPSPVGVLSHGTDRPVSRAEPISATWPAHAYLTPSPLLLSRSEPEERTSELLDADLRATLDPNDPALLRISVATSEAEVEIASYSCFSPSREFRPLPAAIAEQWLVRSQHGWAPETWRLVDYLNTYPPKIVLASGDVVEGDRSWVLQSVGLTIPRDILIKWDWLGVSTSLEVGEAPDGLLTVHQATARNISHSWPQGSLILYDHGKGEIADFIAIDSIPSPQGQLRVCLFHCKAAGGAPSIREGDISEVAAQAIKSQQWQLHPDLLNELVKRHERGRLTFEQGNLDGLRAATHSRPHLLRLQVTIVQPGLSIDDLPQAEGDPRLAILASCYAWCQDTGVDLSIIGA